jgi:hypothetical protein
MLTGKQTRAWLEQYPYLVAKAKRLRREIESLRGEWVVCGAVESSSKHPPYAKREIVIGTPVCTEKEKREQKRVELFHTLEEIEEIERYIDDVEDTRMQEILTRKIIYGEKWPEVAAAFGYKETPDSVRKAYARHFP